MVTCNVLFLFVLVAGPLALAREFLEADSDPFFVLNSDVICGYPFEKLANFHKSHGKEGTLVVSIVHVQLYVQWNLVERNFKDTKII